MVQDLRQLESHQCQQRAKDLNQKHLQHFHVTRPLQRVHHVPSNEIFLPPNISKIEGILNMLLSLREQL